MVKPLLFKSTLFLFTLLVVKQDTLYGMQHSHQSNNPKKFYTAKKTVSDTNKQSIPLVGKKKFKKPIFEEQIDVFTRKEKRQPEKRLPLSKVETNIPVKTNLRIEANLEDRLLTRFLTELPVQQSTSLSDDGVLPDNNYFTHDSFFLEWTERQSF